MSKNNLSRRALTAAVMVLLGTLISCGGDADPPQPSAPVVPVVQAPLVTTNPANQTVAVGATASFSVVASGTAPLTYQWRRGGTNIAGAVSASYTTPVTVAGDSGATFDVVVSNSAGTVTSAAATLTVTTPVSLTISPQPANATVTVGSTATFTSGASCTGGTLAYQWSRSNDNGVTWPDIAGATTTSYSLTTQLTDNGARFRMLATCGNTTTSSIAATLTVNSAPPVGAVLSVLPTGLGAVAKIEFSLGIALEPSGSYVFVESFGLRRLSADRRRVTTLVRIASSLAAAVDGPAATARLFDPRAVAVDAAGNVYITDRGSQTIRRYATDGMVSTLAGLPGQAGFADGTGTVARFNSLGSIAIGPDGDLYVSDNNLIRRVTTAGAVSTYAGSSQGYADGPALSAQFNMAVVGGIAVAANGDLYIADSNNSRVRRIQRSGTTAGAVTTIAGDGTQVYSEGVGVAAGIPSPGRIAVSGTTLYVSDRTARIRLVNLTTLAVTTLAGSVPPFPSIQIFDGTGATASFDNSAGGFAVNPDGSLLVSDRRQLRTVSALGVVRTLGAAYSVSQNGSIVSPDGLVSDQIDFLFSRPAAITADAAGNVLVADDYRSLRRITPTGSVSLVAGLLNGLYSNDGAGSAAQFQDIRALATEANGNIFVGDKHAVRKVTAAGVSSLVAGSYDTFGYANGLGGAARFNTIRGLAVDAGGSIYVTDASTNTIRRIDTGGNVSTYAGEHLQIGLVDGPVGTATLQSPGVMAFAPDGSLYFTDQGNLRVRRITANGTVSTIFGTGGAGITGLVFDTDGALYFCADAVGRLAPLSTTPQYLIGATAPGVNNGFPNSLGTNPQTLGWCAGMALLAPKKLAVLGGGEVLLATLP